MKFTVLFITCCLTLASAYDQLSIGTLTGSINKFIQKLTPGAFKGSINKFVQEREVNCENHKGKCDAYVAEVAPSDAADNEKKSIKEICDFIMNQYLCGGKIDGVQFAKVFTQGMEMIMNAPMDYKHFMTYYFYQ